MTTFFKTISRALCSITLIGGLFALSGTSAFGKDLTPEEIVVTTPLYSPEDSFVFREGTYTYDVNWSGISAGKAELNVVKEGDKFRITASAQTNSFIDVFYELRYFAEGMISASSFRPLWTAIGQKENSKIKDTRITFSDDGAVHSVLKKKGKNAKVVRFQRTNFTLDPFSATILARSVDWAPGVERSFDTFDGKSRYLVKLKCVKKDFIKVADKHVRVWVIEPYVKNLNKQKKHSKLRKAYIYVTADQSREMLGIKSELLLGSVNVELESYRPPTKKPQGVRWADADPTGQWKHWLMGDRVAQLPRQESPAKQKKS